jgi:hypothetical protein
MKSRRAATFNLLAQAAHWLRVARKPIHLCLAALLFVHSARAALVSFGFTNSVGQADTNYFKVIPVSGPVAQADGSFTTIGLPIRITPAADGRATNQLAQNNWLVTNAFLGSGYYIRVPLDNGGTVYPSGKLLISGGNLFVTVFSDQSGTNVPTFNQLTNVFGGKPLVSTNLPGLTNLFITLLDATNVANAFANSASNSLYDDYTTRIAVVAALIQSTSNFLYNDYTAKIALVGGGAITNAYGTNLTTLLLTGQRLYVPTNFDGAGLAGTVGGNLTNLVNSASNTLAGLGITNAYGTNLTTLLLSGQRLYVPTNFDAAGGSNFLYGLNIAASNYLQSAKVSATNGYSTGQTASNLTATGQLSLTNVAGILNGGGRDDIAVQTDNGNINFSAGGANGGITATAAQGVSIQDGAASGISSDGAGNITLTSGSGPFGNLTLQSFASIVFAAAGTINNFVTAPSSGHTNIVGEINGGAAVAVPLSNFLLAGDARAGITNAYGTNALTLSVNSQNIYAPTNFDIKGGSNFLYGLNSTSSNFLASLNSTASNALSSFFIIASNYLQAAKVTATNGYSTFQVASNLTARGLLAATNVIGYPNSFGNDDIGITSTNGSITVSANTNSSGSGTGGGITLFAINGASLVGENGNSSITANDSQGGVFIDADDANARGGKIVLQSPGGTKFQNNIGPVSVFNLIDSPASTNVLLETPAGLAVGIPVSSFLLAGDSRAGITNAYGTNRPTVLVASQNIYIPTNWDYAGGSNILYGRETTASNALQAQNAGTTNFLYNIELPKTNGAANGLLVSNLVTEGNVSFGRDGQATNIISSTNVIGFFNAGSPQATNGVFVWAAGSAVYTNWQNGAILTNNTTAWLMQTNGVTLYSLAGGNPIGNWSAVNGSLPAPTSFSSFYFNGNGMAFIGFLSITNLQAMSNNIVTNVITTITTITTNNFIANTNGFGTNTALYNISALQWASGNILLGFGTYGAATANNFIAGSTPNLASITDLASGSAVIEGINNTISGSKATQAFIAGGSANVITQGCFGVISGGILNKIIGGSSGVTSDGIFGGSGNVISNTAIDANISTILGGQNNFITQHGDTASGRNVTLTNDANFGWSDGSNLRSTTNSQALFSATNGLVLTGPLWLSGSAMTNSGIYYASNQFNLFGVTNAMPNFAYWLGSSNGILTVLFYSNGVPYQKALWP